MKSYTTFLKWYADLSEPALVGSNLTGANLSGANLSGSWEAAIGTRLPNKGETQKDRSRVVVLNQLSSGYYDEIIGRIVSATGWPKELAEIEIDCGFPVTLAARLTFAEALDLKDKSVVSGLLAEVKNMT